MMRAWFCNDDPQKSKVSWGRTGGGQTDETTHRSLDDDVLDELGGLSRSETRDEGQDVLLVLVRDGVVDDDADVIDDVDKGSLERRVELLDGHLEKKGVQIEVSHRNGCKEKREGENSQASATSRRP